VLVEVAAALDTVEELRGIANSHQQTEFEETEQHRRRGDLGKLFQCLV
jgi:hypothetical protein